MGKRELNLCVYLYRWINQGSRKPLQRKDPKYLKSYFCIKTESGKCDKGFRQEVYFPIENTEHIRAHPAISHCSHLLLKM